MPLILKIENEEKYILVREDYPASFLRDFEEKSIKYIAPMPELSTRIEETFPDVQVSRTEVGSGYGKHMTSYYVLSSPQLMKLIELEAREMKSRMKSLEESKKVTQMKFEAFEGLKEIIKRISTPISKRQ
jgi:hypothetical protein